MKQIETPVINKWKKKIFDNICGTENGRFTLFDWKTLGILIEVILIFGRAYSSLAGITSKNAIETLIQDDLIKYFFLLNGKLRR